MCKKRLKRYPQNELFLVYSFTHLTITKYPCNTTIHRDIPKSTALTNTNYYIIDI